MNKNKKWLFGFFLVFLPFVFNVPTTSASHTDLNAACNAAGGKYASSKDACIIEPSGRVQGDFFNFTTHEKIGVCCVTAVKLCTTAGSQYSCVANVGSCSPGTESKAYACSDTSKPVCCFTPSTSKDPVPNITGLNYQLLEKIPGTSGLGSDLPGYVSAIYKIALIVVTLSAVLMLSVGGFMYLTSAGNTSAMGSAKTVIVDALIGLVIALAAWLVLYIINPDLVKVSLSTLPPVSGGQTYQTTPVTPGTGAPGTCGGLTPQSGINCGDASQKLADILTCMKGKGITATVSSVGDSQGFDKCKNSWSRPPCAHAETSCHYGGGKSKTDAECQKSHAADLSVRNAAGNMDLSIANAIKAAATACGARVNDETNLPGVAPHIHISDQTSCCSL